MPFYIDLNVDGLGLIYKAYELLFFIRGKPAGSFIYFLNDAFWQTNIVFIPGVQRIPQAVELLVQVRVILVVNGPPISNDNVSFNIVVSDCSISKRGRVIFVVSYGDEMRVMIRSPSR